MSNVLDKLIVKLNKNWQAFELLTVRKAITMLCSESNGEKPGYAMDFITLKGDDGEPVLQYANPVSWDEWITLPVRDHDYAIETSRGAIRCPLVVICANYNKIHMRKPKLGKEAIARRDGYVCQYSGEKLSRSEGNLDHVIPRDLGGQDTWENLVWCRKQINFDKGNKTNKEAGLKLIREPKAPASTPAVIRVDDLPADTRYDLTPFVLK